MKILTILIFAIAFTAAYCENPEWINFNSNYSVTIALEGDYLWLGGDGVVKFNRKTFEKTYFNKANSGLPHNLIEKILVDSYGNKWILTNYQELVKYDDVSWEVIDLRELGGKEYSYGILTVDKLNNLWVVKAGKGLLKYDGTNWFEYNTTNSELASDSILDGISDTSGNIWFLHKNKISKFDGVNWTIFPIDSTILDMSEYESMNIDKNGVLIFAGYNFFAKFDGTLWEVMKSGYNGMPEIRGYSITSDKYGNYWFGNLENITRFDGKNWKEMFLYRDSFYPMIVALTDDPDGNIWFAQNSFLNNGHGLGLCKNDSVLTFNISIYGGSNFPTNIDFDSHGNVWLATYFVGEVIRFVPSELTNNDHSTFYYKNSTILDLDVDLKDNVWFVQENIGATMYSKTDTLFFTKNQGLYDWENLFVEHDLVNNNIWILGAPSNASIINIDSMTIEQIKFPYYQIVFDTNNVMWGSNWHEIGQLDKETNEWVKYPIPKDKDYSLGSMTLDNYNKLWCNIHQGIVCFDGVEYKEYNNKYRISYSVFTRRNIAVDSKNNIWSGSEYGLLKFDGTNWTHFTAENSGLPDDKIYSLAIDKRDNVWIASAYGLAVFREGGVVLNIQDEIITEFKPELMLYPNPSSGIININLNNLKLGISEISIYDIMGIKHLYYKQNQSNNFTLLDCSTLTNGFYFCVVNTGKETISSHFIIMK